MKKTSIMLLSVLVAGVLTVPSGAAGKVSRLGTDPAGDAPAAVDLTYLDVTTAGKALEIRIGVDRMVPVFGGYPEGPAIEWIFSTGKRVFLAEAVAGRTPRFFFFELKGDTFEQLQGMTGTYDPADGFIRMLVPFKLIGAKKGTRIAGYHKPLEQLNTKDHVSDADSHLHTAPGQTEYIDYMETTKTYQVP